MTIVRKCQYKCNWLIIIVCTFTLMSGLYSYSNFAASHDYFKDYFKYQYSSSEFEFYYNVSYSFGLLSLIFSAAIVGVLCDKYGSSLVMLYQWIILSIGEWIILFSIRYQMFLPILVGRVLIIGGSQSLWVSVSLFVSEYASKESNGLAQSFVSMGTLALSASLIVAPIICQTFGLLNNQFVEFLLINLSTILVYLLFHIDFDFNEKIEEQQKKRKFNESIQIANSQKSTCTDTNLRTFNCIEESGVDTVTDSKAPEYISQFDKIQEQETQSTVQENLQKIKNYPLVYWYYYLSNSLCIICTQGVEIFGPVFLTTYFGYTPIQAGFICSLSPFTGLIAPFLGTIIDKVGNLIAINVLATFLHFFPILLLPYFPYPSITFLFFGIGNTFRISTQLPILNIMIPKNTQGLGFALIKVFKGLSGFVVVGINGWIAASCGYLPVVWINSGLALAGLIYGIYTYQEYKRLCKEEPKFATQLEKLNNPDSLIVKQ